MGQKRGSVLSHIETRGRRSAKQDAIPSGAVGAVKAYPGAHLPQTGCPANPDRDGLAVLVMPNDADVRTAREPPRACEFRMHGGAHSTYSTSMPRQEESVYTSFATHCTRQRTEKGLSHAYDRKSGWCRFGCGNRDDGRITNREGSVIDQGPTYSDAELTDLFHDLTEGATR